MNYSTGRYYTYCSPVCQTGGSSDTSSSVLLNTSQPQGCALSSAHYVSLFGLIDEALLTAPGDSFCLTETYLDTLAENHHLPVLPECCSATMNQEAVGEI